MSDYYVERIGPKPKLKKPILVEGLPGVGNVARIAVDYLINRLKAKHFLNVYSKHFPNSVFINEKKIIELPKTEFYHYKNKKGNDLILMVGDVQPGEEFASYSFSQSIIDISKQLGVTQLITLGGITARASTKNPPVYGACSSEKFIPSLKKAGVKFDRQGAVIIVGAAGLLVGLGKLAGIEGFSLLAETGAEPNQIGLAAANSILEILIKYLKLNVSLKDFDKQIAQMLAGTRKGLVMRRKILKRLHIPEPPAKLNYLG
jgi:hypothetical protein